MAGAELDFSAYIAERTRDFTGRDWLLAEIDDWLADPEGPPFFLLTGAPGSGKSAIAARLVQMHPELTAYHFCIARNARTIDPLLFTRSLSRQLCRFDGFAAGILKDSNIDLHAVQNIQANYGQAIAVKIENLTVNAPSATVAFTHSVIEPLKALCTDSFEQQVFILVDGLDEAAQQPGRETIVSLLANAGELPSQVRCLLTLRPDGAVLGQFERQDVKRLDIDLRRTDNLKDIQDYTDRQATQSEMASNLKARLAEANMEPEALVEEILQASDGNFLYVVWLLRSIVEGTHRLDQLDALPQGLDGIYREFLRGRGLGVDKGLWRGIYRPLLGTLAAARSELTADQLGGFAQLEKQDLRDALADLQQFLEPMRFAQGRYQLYHQSVVDFLTDEEQADEFWIDPVPAHRRIAQYYWDHDHPNWQKLHDALDDDYGLESLATHLYHSGQGDRLYELIIPEWRRDKLYHLKSDHSFMQDVEWALKAARREKDDRLTRYIGLSLMAGSIATKSNDVIAEAVGAMVALGEHERADAYLQTMSEPGVRTGAMLQMARAYWQLYHRHGKQLDAQRARRYFESALREGAVALKIFTNPKPIIDDLLNWRLIDEAIAVAVLLSEERRMDWVWRDTLPVCLAELASVAAKSHPDLVEQWRSQYPDSFGQMDGSGGVSAAGSVLSQSSGGTPPGVTSAADAMHLADVYFSQGDLERSDVQLRSGRCSTKGEVAFGEGSSQL